MRMAMPTGDEFLRRVAGCLRSTIGPDAFVSRIGGDEFVVLLPDADELAARAVAQDLIEAISREHSLPDGRRARVGCSVGLSLAPSQGREPEVLLARADAALYEVKNQGKGTRESGARSVPERAPAVASGGQEAVRADLVAIRIAQVGPIGGRSEGAGSGSPFVGAAIGQSRLVELVHRRATGCDKTYRAAVGMSTRARRWQAS